MRKPQFIVLVVLLDAQISPSLFVFFGYMKAYDVNRRRKKKRFLGLYYLNYHSPEYFGLCRSNAIEAGSKKKDWTKPTKETEIQ